MGLQRNFHRGPNFARSGLVTYLDAFNANSYNGTGNIWTDISINLEQRNATLFNTPEFTGLGIQLNGSTQYMSIATPPVQFTPHQEWTVEMFIYPIAGGGWLVSPNSAGSDQGITYSSGFQRITLGTTEFADVNNRTLNSSNGSVPLNLWTHVVCIINNLDTKIYINGRLNIQRIETIGVANWTGTWWLGRRGQFNQFYWNGQYGMIRIYNRELTAFEVKQNYYANKGRYFNLLHKE